jgi:S-adenosylmethionine/arginine decarboxylase-like enzyme
MTESAAAHPALFHIHMLGKAYLSRPPITVEAMNAWLLDLVEGIKMVVLAGPLTVDCKTLGNEGVTGAIVIETSHITGHCWSSIDRPFLMMDAYSCVSYDPQIVIDITDKHFGIVSYEYMLVDRNDGIKVVDHKSS